MSEPVLKINIASIVLTGSFNPAIFQPQWFVRQNLLPAEEAEKAEIKLVSPEFCQFETAGLTIQVVRERFAVFSKPDANPTLVRDLAAGTFFVLEHTPLTALGLNRDMHFAMPSEEIWHKVGDTIVPKDIWKKILAGRVGMRSLSLQAEVPGFPDENQDMTKMTVRVEPSLSEKFGLFIATNEHHQAPMGSGANYLRERIRNRWEGAFNYAAEIAEFIISSTTK
jgi:hypothetical protein